MDSKRRCARCGKRLKKGGLAYRLKAELISHFDGHLEIDNRKDIATQIKDLEEQLKEYTEKELEEQIYKKFDYLVCSECRDRLDKLLQPEDLT